MKKHAKQKINIKIPHQVRDDKEKGTEGFIEMYTLGYSFGYTL